MFKQVISTSKRNQMIDISSMLNDAVVKSGVKDGQLCAFVPHTTAAITINENADPDVVNDMIETMDTLVPNKSSYRHMEGNSDSHVKSSLFGPSLTLIISEGKLVLGRWQGVYFCEFDGPRQRNLFIDIR